MSILWLSYRGELTAYFSKADTRRDVVNAWNKAYPGDAITTHFTSGDEIIGYFESKSGLQPRLFSFMRSHRFVPPFGVAVLSRLEEETKQLFGEDAAVQPVPGASTVLRSCDRNCSLGCLS
jgi:hypothetical protein